jgi:hypothetical protein
MESSKLLSLHYYWCTRVAQLDKTGLQAEVGEEGIGYKGNKGCRVYRGNKGHSFYIKLKIEAASRDLLLTSCKTNHMLVSFEMLASRNHYC